VRASTKTPAWFCVIALLACARIDVIARESLQDDAGAGEDAGPVADAGDGAAPGEDARVPPDGECPYLRRPAGDAAMRPTIEVTASALQRAVCACNSYSGSAPLVVDGAAGADVAVHSAFDQEVDATISGSLSVAGDDGIGIGSGATLSVGGELASAGPLEGAEASVEVLGDAAIAGRIDLMDLVVGGTLTQPAGAALQVASQPSLGGMRSAEVQVEAPCACDRAELFDVGGAVRDAVAGVPPLPEGALQERCAEYWVDGAFDGDFDLEVAESAALYVRGDLHVDALRVSTAPSAVLDVYVEGNLLVTGPLELGAAAGAVRLHAGGLGTIELVHGGTLRGTLYAPRAHLVLGGPLELTGALLLHRIASAGGLTVHYDPDVVAAH
jgi:hypothetical protein